MGDRYVPTCDDCYFRQEALCALPGDRPCPTFRAAARKGLNPPVQPQLVARPVEVLVAASTGPLTSAGRTS
jgi:hypothetical protein